MDGQHQRMIEGNLYVFSMPSNLDKASLAAGIDEGLETANCGKILGSGMLLGGDPTICLEVGAFDRDKADAVISRVCQKMKCHDYEMAWD
jgi:hypothetical protein